MKTRGSKRGKLVGLGCAPLVFAFSLMFCGFGSSLAGDQNLQPESVTPHPLSEQSVMDVVEDKGWRDILVRHKDITNLGRFSVAHFGGESILSTGKVSLFVAA